MGCRSTPLLTAAIAIAVVFSAENADAQTCPGTTEVCNGIDDDCNGATDDGIAIGDSCAMAYDTVIFPGARFGGECRLGRLICDPAGSGQMICLGGVGPLPEICDGKDNDCDGVIDEVGPAPDGLDGSADPLEPTHVIGQSCGTDVGECMTGVFSCLNGTVVCVGNADPRTEICDCLDNDCDGQADEDLDGTGPDLCGSGALCIESDQLCACSLPCSAGELSCPTSQSCQSAFVSNTGMAGTFCLTGCAGSCAQTDAAQPRDAAPSTDGAPPDDAPPSTDAALTTDAASLRDAAPMADANPVTTSPDASSKSDAGSVDDTPKSDDDGGCSCRMAVERSVTLPWWLGASLVFLAMRGRQRRRDESRN